MTKDERLSEEYWIYNELIRTISADYSARPKDHFSKELVRIYRTSEDKELKISYFESYFLPLMKNKKNRVSKYKELLKSQEVFELICDKDIKRYILALRLSKENNVFDEKDMLKALSSLLEERKKTDLYNIISKMNFMNNKENVEKIKKLVK